METMVKCDPEIEIVGEVIKSLVAPRKNFGVSLSTEAVIDSNRLAKKVSGLVMT